MRNYRCWICLLLCTLLLFGTSLGEGAVEPELGDEPAVVDEISAQDAPEPAASEAPEESVTTEVLPEETPAAQAPEEETPEASETTEEPFEVAVQAAQLRAEPANLLLGVGEKSAPLRVTLDGNSAEGCSFVSSNARIAKVSAKGVVEGVKAGSTTIAVTTSGGATTAVNVEVRSAPKSISLTPAKSATMGVGESMDLKIALSKNSTGAVTFDRYDSKIISVSKEGRITALAAGKTKLRAITYNQRAATLTITVKPAPQSVTMDAAQLTMGVGEEHVFSATPSKGSAGALAYTSSDPSVLEIDAASGKAVARAVGEAEIRATTYNDKTATCRVQVLNAPETLTVAPASLTLGVKEVSAPLQIALGASAGECGGGYTITSSSKRATVDAKGRVTGVSAGSATITVKTYNGLTRKVSVTVQKAPSKVTLPVKSANLGVGETLPLKASLPSRTAGTVTYVSSSPSVATVNHEGLVTAVGPGDAKITAKTFNGKTATCSLHVGRAPEEIRLGSGTAALGAGEKQTLRVNLLPEGAVGSCTFSSGNAAVVKVDSKTGAMTAVSAGEVTITARTYNGLTAACVVTVSNAPTGVQFQEKSLVLAVGDTYQLLPPQLKGTNVASRGLTYASGNTRYVQVSQDGLVKGVKAGSATVKVTTYNGKKASLKVTVKAAPKSISLETKDLTLYMGDTFTPKVSFAGGLACSYVLKSSAGGVVAVEGDAIRAVAAGSATITAESYNGKRATLQVTVLGLPQSVSLDRTSLRLGAGDRTRLAAIMPKGQGSPLTYASSDRQIATVDTEGNVTAVVPGRATITVRTINEKSASCTVEVLAAPTALRLTPSDAAYALDEGSVQLNVAFGGAQEGGRCAFESSDPAVASVDGSGRVSFHKSGRATITARTYNGLSAQSTLQISTPASGMCFASAEYRVALGDTIQLPVSYEQGGGSYRLSAENAALLQANGISVTALALGATRVTATSYNGLTASCGVTVVPAPTGIAFASPEIELSWGQEVAAGVKVLPDGVGSWVLKSNAPEIVSVDAQRGVLRACALGSAIVTATTYDGRQTAQCTVRVTGPLVGVKIGIDPGHQAKANLKKEAIAPGSSKTKIRVTAGTSGVSTRVAEHVVNLQVAFKLREALQALGAEVYMTRESADVDISNQQRAIMMNNYDVDLVLRLHCNSISKNSGKNGISMWVRKTGTGKAECAKAAEALIQQMCKATGARNDGVHKSDSYTGLNWSTVPSVLVEMGYMSNSREDKLLVSDAYQQKLVAGMINGICVYLDRPLPQ